MMEIVDPGIVEIALFHLLVGVSMTSKAKLIASLSNPVKLWGSHNTVVDRLNTYQRDSLAHSITESLA